MAPSPASVSHVSGKGCSVLVTLLTAALMCGFVTGPQSKRPLTDVVRVTSVDVANGRFAITRTVLVVVPFVHEIEVVRDGKTVKVLEFAGGETEQEVVEEYTIKYWRLTDKKGKELDWARAKGKTVVMYGSNQLPDKTLLQLLAKDTLILYGRD